MPVLKKVNYLTVHVSASPNGKDFRAKDIHQWHLQNGWDGIGYHSVICVDGAIEKGRPEYWVGAHCKPINPNSLAVCVIGTDEFSELQLESLAIQLREWLHKHPDARIVGHSDLEPDRKPHCPGKQILAFLDATFPEHR